MTTAAMVYDMVGTAEQNAALALIMFATMASPTGGANASDRLNAAGIGADLLAAAAAGGFDGKGELLRLVGAGAMTPVLEQLGFDAVRCAGGAVKFFELLELCTTSEARMGARH